MLAAVAGVSQVCQLLPSRCGHLGRSAHGQGVALKTLCRTLVCTCAMPACKYSTTVRESRLTIMRAAQLALTCSSNFS